MTRDDLIATIEERYPDAQIILADGFEDAFVGIAERCASPHVAIYDYDRMLNVLVQRDGMTEEEADEFLQFNVLGAYVGEGTPWYITYRLRETPSER